MRQKPGGALLLGCLVLVLVLTVPSSPWSSGAQERLIARHNIAPPEVLVLRCQ